MEIENSVTIHGDLKTIYDHAARVELWPKILPHYREVLILQNGQNERLVSMQCFRRFGILKWPCRWRARQTLIPESGQIRYEHVDGPAKGMRVLWSLENTPAGVRASIRHEMDDEDRAWRRFYQNKLVGSLFVHSIAGQTLATIKRIVEGERG